MDEYKISGTTKLVCLLGSPVAHSMSPAMHNESFRYHGLDYRYLCFDVGEAELEKATEGLRVMGARGWNLTMPCKNRMTDLCDRLSPAAKFCGAVNTVVNDDGILTGHTTDGAGYMRAVREAGYDLKGKTMTLLGAGGAATAILVQAALDGLGQIRVFNRRSANLDRLSPIAEQLNAETNCRVSIHLLPDDDGLRASIADSDILTNATNVGMAPQTEACLIPDPAWFHQSLIVSDIIYNPRETRLLFMAKEAGCPTVGGLPMLLYQGAYAFELWTGLDMPVELIREKYFS